MKHYYCIVAMMIALSSCYSPIRDAEEVITEETETEPVAKTKAFTFHVKGDFLTNYEDMTRASIRLEDDNTAAITDLWVLDYAEDGTLLQTVHQTSSDTDFGHPSMNLTYGHHDVKFIASKGDTPVLTTTGSNPSLSWTKVKDTFTLDYPVEVQASSNGNRAPELKRAVSGVRLIMTDKIPTCATKVEVTLSARYSSLSLPSLEVGGRGEFLNTFAFSASDAGLSPMLNTYSLAPATDWQTDVTVKAYKGTEVISEFTIEGVELRKNRMTELKGEIFDRTSGFSVSIDDAWDDASTILF